MKRTLFTVGFYLVAVGLVLIGYSPVEATDLEPPVAKIEAKVDTLFGVVLVDNYSWLRGKEKPEVIQYLEVENAYTDAVMSGTESAQEEMFQEIKSRIKETDLSVPVRRGDYYYYYRNEEGKQYRIYCRKKGNLEAKEEVLLDVNQMAEGHDFMSLGAYVISPDHSLLAYATDTLGSERYALHVKNLVSGELYPETISNTTGDLVWFNDNKTFLYSMPDDAWRPYQVYRHQLGTDPKDDELVYQEDDEKYWTGLSRTKSGAYLLVGTESKMTSEYRFLSADEPDGTLKLISPREPGVEYSVYNHDDQFLILTNYDAVNFRLMKTPISTPSKEHWTELIPHHIEVKLDGLDVFKDYMVIYQRENGLPTLEVWNLTGDEKHTVTFPEPVYAYHGNANPEFNTDILRFTYMSLTTPNSVYDYNMKTRERELKKKREVLGDFDSDNYVSERVFATASDGTAIPISLVYRKGTVKDGSHPLYLTGYGSYGMSYDPYFSTSRISLLDRGFIYAIAHIRGGGEMGRPWYNDGKLLKKKNTFTDFIACADHLVDQKYTSRDKLVINGGSAGGLLIGAVLNMRPDLCGVAVADVPFVDVMNTMLDASIPLTVVEYEEWGNPNEEEYFRYMLSYSPYDNVKKAAYPNLLIKGGLNDTRVQYWEPAKWTAKLRTMNTSGNRLLLKTNMGAGHGGASGRYDFLKEIAFSYVFILDCLDMLD